MMKLLNTVLVIAGIILAVLLFRQRAELRRVERRITNTEAEVAAQEAMEEPAPDDERPAIEETASKGKQADEPERKRVRVKSRPIDELREMMNDPKRKVFMEAAWSLEMDGLYGSMFRYFDMTLDERRYLRSLLVERKSREEDARATAMSTDPDSKEALQRKGEEALAEIDARIRAFLGDEAYVVYEEYEETVPERQVLAECRKMLSSYDLGLTWEQEDELIRAMRDVRRANAGMDGFFENPGLPPMIGEEEVPALVAEVNRWHESIMEQAGDILTPEQLMVFEQHMGMVRDSMEIGLSIAPMLSGEEATEEL